MNEEFFKDVNIRANPCGRYWIFPEGSLRENQWPPACPKMARERFSANGCNFEDPAVVWRDKADNIDKKRDVGATGFEPVTSCL